MSRSPPTARSTSPATSRARSTSAARSASARRRPRSRPTPSRTRTSPSSAPTASSRGRRRSAPSATTSRTASRCAATRSSSSATSSTRSSSASSSRSRRGSDDAYVVALRQGRRRRSGRGTSAASTPTVRTRSPRPPTAAGSSAARSPRPIDFGTTQLKSNGGTDAMLIKLAATGDLEWVKQFGGRYDDTISHVAVDGNGNIIRPGPVQGRRRTGAASRSSRRAAAPTTTSCSRSTTLNGDHVWSQRFGNAFNDVAGGVAVDPAGHITMVGSFDKSVSFGEGDDHTSLGEADVVRRAATRTDGKLEWAQHVRCRARGHRVRHRDATPPATRSRPAGSRAPSTSARARVTSKGNKDVFALKLDREGRRAVGADAGAITITIRAAASRSTTRAPRSSSGSIASRSRSCHRRSSRRATEGPRASNAPKPDVFVVKLASLRIASNRP